MQNIKEVSSRLQSEESILSKKKILPKNDLKQKQLIFQPRAEGVWKQIKIEKT